MIAVAIICLLAKLALVTAAFAGDERHAGQLLSQTPLPGAPEGASAWRIRYVSTAESGALVEISGVVIVPAGKPPTAAGRNIVAWAHSTSGVAEACAPSTSADVFEQIIGLPGLLRAGDMVTATDFQGLGTPGPTPYLVGISSGRAVLDSVRAARALPNAGGGKRYVIWGMSQGAHAALWAGQLASTYMPELNLLGVAAAAPPTDLVVGYDKISNTLVRALMTGYLAETWSKVYGLDPATFANAAGRLIMRKIANECVRKDVIDTAVDVGMLALTRQIPTKIGDPWLKPLTANSLKPLKVPEPLFIAQGSADEVVNASVTQDFVKASCRAGSVLVFDEMAGGDHLSAAVRSAPQALAFMADRFAGKPPASDCGRIVGKDS